MWRTHELRGRLHVRDHLKRVRVDDDSPLVFGEELANERERRRRVAEPRTEDDRVVTDCELADPVDMGRGERLAGNPRTIRFSENPWIAGATEAGQATRTRSAPARSAARAESVGAPV